MSSLAQRMLEYRARHNMSQTQFAELAKLSPITVVMLENERHNPSRLTRAKIELVLKSEEPQF